MKLQSGSKAVGKTALAIDQELSDASVEAIYREGKTLDLTDTTVIQAGDRVAITGVIGVMETACVLLRSRDNRGERSAAGAGKPRNHPHQPCA